MRPGHLTRRMCLLAALGAAAKALEGRFAEWGTSTDSPHEGRLTAELLNLLPRDSASAIGSEYLRTHRDAMLETGLARALQLETPSKHAPGPGELKRRLASAARADFRHGRIVRVMNWHLALTEARLCAWVARHA
jgi:endonuclease/exonuclease/phosphatase family metal-dependent hydrolase